MEGVVSVDASSTTITRMLETVCVRILSMAERRYCSPLNTDIKTVTSGWDSFVHSMAASLSTVCVRHPHQHGLHTRFRPSGYAALLCEDRPVPAHCETLLPCIQSHA